MNVKSFSFRIFVFIAALLFSFGAFQVAYAADGDLGAASAGALESASADDALETQAVTWRTIMTPEQLRVITLKSEGFGPGYYKIGADFTLGDQPTGDNYATCPLLEGDFVIDFNGHTVQSACETLHTFTVAGANVTFMDSGASSDKVSVNALGLGCIQVQKGSATIQSGNYLCSKFTDAGGVSVYTKNGTLTINGGAFRGSQMAIGTEGGTTTINGGTFYGGYPWALCYMGGNVKIVRGKFYGSKNYYGATFALSALTVGNAFDFNTLLASGSTWNVSGTYYYNTTTSVSPYPGLAYAYAVTPESTVIVSGPQTITASNATKTFGDGAFNLNATTNGDGTLSYSSSNPNVATVDSSGTVTIKGAGTTNITINASATDISKAASKPITLTVNKAANAMTAEGLSANVSVQNVAKAAQTTQPLVKVANNRGTVTYAKTAGSNDLSINASTGAVTVSKGTKAGTYNLTVNVIDAGAANYNGATRSVTVAVTVIKAANTLKAKGLSAKVSAKKVAKKAQITKKLVKVAKNKGKVTFKKVSGAKALSIGKKNGKVVVKKGTKRGTYRIKVKVSAAGNALYKAGSKTVTVAVKVR